jgi:hypothetical protein
MIVQLNPVVPWTVDPTITEQCAIIKQDLEKYDGGGKAQSREDLYADNDQLKRHMRNQDDRSSCAHASDVRCVEAGTSQSFLCSECSQPLTSQ